jgi:Uma2 family endonuclease
MTLATDRPTRPDLQVLPTLVTFDEFVDWYPENSTIRYKLRRGVIVEMPKPKGKHSKVSGKIAGKLDGTIDRLELPYFIPKECLIKLPDESGYEPDVVVLDEEALADEPRWESGSIITQGRSIKIAIEVVSTNWQDDDEAQLIIYESLGIPEYWIVDYLGLGGDRHLGKPKQPTLTLCTLINGEYETRQFRGDDMIVSPTFPDLNLTAAQVLGT